MYENNVIILPKVQENKNKKQTKKKQKALVHYFQKLKMVDQCYYQSVLYVILKNRDLLKTKKQTDY